MAVFLRVMKAGLEVVVVKAISYYAAGLLTALSLRYHSLAPRIGHIHWPSLPIKAGYGQT